MIKNSWTFHKRLKKRLYPYLLGLMVLFTNIACKNVDSVENNSSKPKIIATFLPMYLFTKGVVGNENQVEMLIKPGGEVHDYQATPEDALKLAQGDILIKNGLGIEEFLDKLISNVNNSNLKQIDTSEKIEIQKHNEKLDPHIWLDPVLAKKQVENIRDALINIDSDNAQTYQDNADNYIKQLEELDQQFSQSLASVKGCKLIVFHDAFYYLAKRYELEQISIVEIPEDQITPQRLQAIIKDIKKYNIKALLFEPGLNDKKIQQIASELNLPVENLNPISSGELNPQYYFTAMGNNLKTLEKICK